MALTLLGGIGIFLLGMVLLTDGLKEAAGSALRDLLGRLTGGPTRAAVSGAAITALVQSSSATTLATIGFVSAGLLTFPQSIGLILGANIGTTSTGWIVSVLGLKADIGALALPLVAAGALIVSSGASASQPSAWPSPGSASSSWGSTSSRTAWRASPTDSTSRPSRRRGSSGVSRSSPSARS